MSNRLAGETSPYLLQHADNPVDWYPWGPEAFARAEREDKPILLSIGYSACHWCHVMEHESFENGEIAALMNEHFVSIKVDREERPDIDSIYMAATVALSGSGGWPMTVFLTQDKQPFFAGTYFPPSDKYGRPGFPTVLRRIAELWKSERSTLQSQAAELSEHVREQSTLVAPLAVQRAAIDGATAQLSASFDARYGGFGRAPKFPPCGALSLLLRHHHRIGDADSLRMVEATLDAMKNGGMYDHLAGGFARYSTDERWLVPHFEKMLYDNAQLTCAYLDAFQVTRNAEYARVARETLDYVLREMSGQYGYFSATDADSEGVEGKFFVWSHDEVLEQLGPETGDHFALYYDVTPHGNWEEHNILNTPRPLARVAEELGVSSQTLAEELALAKTKLYTVRLQRVPPLLDDKVLTSWNGLMLSAMAAGYRVLGDTRYLDSGLTVADALLTTMARPDGGLYHTARAGRAQVPGFLEDYAFLGEGLLALYEAGGPAKLLREADRLAARMLSDFEDPESGAFFDTAHDAERLLVRPREGHDNAIPSANGVAAGLLAKLSHHLERPHYRERAERAVTAYGKLIARAPRAFASTLWAVDFMAAPPLELSLLGTPGEESYERLRRAIASHYLPNRVIAHLDPNSPPSADDALPLLAGKRQIAANAALFVCRASVCDAPITSSEELDASLERHTAPR